MENTLTSLVIEYLKKTICSMVTYKGATHPSLHGGWDVDKVVERSLQRR